MFGRKNHETQSNEQFNKRNALIATGLAGTAALLAACGPASADEPPKTTTSVASSEQVPSTVNGSEIPSGATSVTITSPETPSSANTGEVKVISNANLIENIDKAATSEQIAEAMRGAPVAEFPDPTSAAKRIQDILNVLDNGGECENSPGFDVGNPDFKYQSPESFAAGKQLIEVIVGHPVNNGEAKQWQDARTKVCNFRESAEKLIDKNRKLTFREDLEIKKVAEIDSNSYEVTGNQTLKINLQDFGVNNDAWQNEATRPLDWVMVKKDGQWTLATNKINAWYDGQVYHD